MALGSSGVLRTRRDHSQGLTKHRLLPKRADLKAIALVFRLTQFSSLLLGEISHQPPCWKLQLLLIFFVQASLHSFIGFALKFSALEW